MRKDQIIENVCKTLKEDKVITDYRYDHFEEYEAIPPPFAVYRRVAPQNFSADGIVYHHGESVDLELYASDPEEMATIMEAVETQLDASELFYQLTADTAYIDSEKFYESLYEL